MSLNNKHIYKRIVQWLPALALIISLLLRQFSSATAIENWYSYGVFQVFRKFWDYSIALSPIPLYYVFWLLIIFLLIRGIRKLKRPAKWQGKIISGVGMLLRFCCWLAVAFLWCWGFNYGRIKVEDKMSFQPYNMTFEELTQSVQEEAIALEKLRQKVVGNDTTAIDQQPTAKVLENEIRSLVVMALKKHGYPYGGHPRGRQLHPKGILLRFSTSGVYWPWAGEGNIDAGMHPLKKPPVLAHELAHAYGFGEEGSCSFWAWLAGQEATDPWINYAIRLDYWRNLARKWLRTDREGYMNFYRNQLAPGIRQDIIAIVKTSQQYPDIMPEIRDVAYDTYLKSQGVKDGLLSYGRVVQLVEGYRRKTAQ